MPEAAGIWDPGTGCNLGEILEILNAFCRLSDSENGLRLQTTPKKNWLLKRTNSLNEKYVIHARLRNFTYLIRNGGVKGRDFTVLPELLRTWLRHWVTLVMVVVVPRQSHFICSCTGNVIIVIFRRFYVVPFSTAFHYGCKMFYVFRPHRSNS